jgi:hypothetical protein
VPAKAFYHISEKSIPKLRKVGSNQAKTKYSHHFIPGKISSIHPDWSSSQNWADNEATAGRGTYRAATIEFNVPYISLSNPNAAVSVWAGVGGDQNYAGNGWVLPQVGVSVNPSGNSQYDESWWEVAPVDNSEINLPLKRLNPGDRVYAYVSSNLNNDGYDYFEIENESIDNYNSHTVSGSSYFSDSATGECVVERPSLYGNPVPLAEFDPNGNKTEELDSCEIDNATGYQQSVGNWPHIDYHMFNGGTQLAYPESLFNGGQDFWVQWQRSS